MDDPQVESLAQFVKLFREGDVFQFAVGVEQDERARVSAVRGGSQNAHARGDSDAVGEQEHALRPRAEAERAVGPVDVEPGSEWEGSDTGAEPLVRTDGEGDPRWILGA